MKEGDEKWKRLSWNDNMYNKRKKWVRERERGGKKYYVREKLKWLEYVFRDMSTSQKSISTTFLNFHTKKKLGWKQKHKR